MTHFRITFRPVRYENADHSPYWTLEPVIHSGPHQPTSHERLFCCAWHAHNGTGHERCREKQFELCQFFEEVGKEFGLRVQ